MSVTGTAYQAGFASIGRAISLAHDWETKKLAWANGLHEALTKWNGIAKADVISECQAIAEAKDLIEHFGQDEIQRILSDEVLKAAEPAKPNGQTKPEPAEVARIQSSAQFVKDFVPPDYLIDGILQRRFCYSITGKTGSGKTAVVLLASAHVGIGRSIGNIEVAAGRVLYFAGENPDDIRMRWIALAQHVGFDIETIQVSFIAGVFKISQFKARIEQEIRESGDVALVVVDTGAAFFEGDDANSNTQQIAHARLLRSLVALPGGPCVLALCHPVKNATRDNLIPYGGGGFINEMDGNLTCWNDGSVEVHWLGKFRGPDFAPLSFLMRTVTNERLKDSGRLIPTVVAEYLSDTAQEELTKVARGQDEMLLAEIDRNPKASRADLARALGWSMKNGEPHKMMVQRGITRLREFKLITVEHDRISLTDKGRKKLDGEDQ
jgi:hypothetical protein